MLPADQSLMCRDALQPEQSASLRAPAKHTHTHTHTWTEKQLLQCFSTFLTSNPPLYTTIVQSPMTLPVVYDLL